VIKLQYHRKQNKVFLFKCYWYDTIDREIRVDPYHGLVEINTKARLCNINDVFIFSKQYQKIYYTYTSTFKKDHFRVDWLSVVKTKPCSHVQVVYDGKDKVIVGDNVFQIGELVDAYWVAPSTDLEKKLNFLVDKIIFIGVDVEKLNDILRTSGHTKVDEDNNIN
jgi:hypothetical protein